MAKRGLGSRRSLIAVAASALAIVVAAPAGSAQATRISLPILGGGTAAPVGAASTVGNFSFGQLPSSLVGGTGCGTNNAGEPAIHVSRANNVFLGSENGLGGGSA